MSEGSGAFMTPPSESGKYAAGPITGRGGLGTHMLSLGDISWHFLFFFFYWVRSGQ